MSLFTKHRKAARIKRQERIKRLEQGCNQIEASMNRTIEICRAIERDHPDFDNLDEDKRIEILKEYYK